MMSGLMSAGMAGLSPQADWGWGAGQQYGTNPFSGQMANYGDYQQAIQAQNAMQGAFTGWWGN